MKNILVLGAGFGGLRTAIDIDRGLRKTGLPGYNVILIDQYPYHTFIQADITDPALPINGKFDIIISTVPKDVDMLFLEEKT